MSLVSLESLIKNKVYLGHSKSKWHPRIAFFTRAVVRSHYLIDLVQTAKLLSTAYTYLFKMAKRGHKFLFVGTKAVASPWTKRAAICCGSFYVNQVWRSGLLTNWTFLRGRVRLLAWFNRVFLWLQKRDSLKALPKGLVLSLERRYTKLSLEMSGLVGLHSVPNIIIIVDPEHEEQAILESIKLKRILVGITDSASHVSSIHMPVPANDDSSLSVKTVLQILSTAILRGKLVRYYVGSL